MEEVEDLYLLVEEEGVMHLFLEEEDLLTDQEEDVHGLEEDQDHGHEVSVRDPKGVVSVEVVVSHEALQEKKI